MLDLDHNCKPKVKHCISLETIMLLAMIGKHISLGTMISASHKMFVRLLQKYTTAQQSNDMLNKLNWSTQNSLHC